MLDENVQILTKAQFLEDFPQFSHTAKLYLVQHVQRYDIRNYLCRSPSGRLPCLSRRQPPKTFSIGLNNLQSAVESLGVTDPRCNVTGAARQEVAGRKLARSIKTLRR
jgi:hypothetical protein